jgi:aminoglycoside phosphotransferase family enzyme
MMRISRRLDLDVAQSWQGAQQDIRLMPHQDMPSERETAQDNMDSLAVETAQLVAFLRSLKANSGTSATIEVKETHKSWVFLVGDEVYKLKKPVRDHLQDLTTLSAREANARNEVRLNRRLAPDVYLGVAAVTRCRDGGIEVDGKGAIIDWLVHMRRVPEEFMLDQMILRGHVPEERIGALIDLMAEFYQQLPRPSLNPKDYAAHFEREQLENRRVLTMSQFPLDRQQVTALLDAFDDQLNLLRELLEKRAGEGKIVEGHGDLRPEHVCLRDPPLIIDCLEFNLGLRLVDPHDELSYLGLECGLLGAQWISERLTSGYAQRAHDPCPKHLISFYTAYRAFLRARLCLAHLLDPGPQEVTKWISKARSYLVAAERAVLSLGKPGDRPSNH